MRLHTGGVRPAVNLLYLTSLSLAYATPNSTAALDWSAETRAILQRVVKSAADSEAATKIVLAIGEHLRSLKFNHVLT